MARPRQTVAWHDLAISVQAKLGRGRYHARPLPGMAWHERRRRTKSAAAACQAVLVAWLGLHALELISQVKPKPGLARPVKPSHAKHDLATSHAIRRHYIGISLSHDRRSYDRCARQLKPKRSHSANNSPLYKPRTLFDGRRPVRRN